MSLSKRKKYILQIIVLLLSTQNKFKIVNKQQTLKNMSIGFYKL